MIRILFYFIIGVPWHDIDDIKIDGTIPYLSRTNILMSGGKQTDKTDKTVPEWN
jgi:hypothetical protein